MAIKVVAPAKPSLKIDSSATPGQIGVFVAKGEQGPQGPQGIQGPQGPKGDTGPAGADGTAAVIDHIADETPHPSYDDTPSFTLLFENRIA